MTGRKPQSNPANLLRASLEAGDGYEAFRRLAIAKCQKAARLPTWAAAAEALGVTYRTLQKLRADHPEAFSG